VSKRVGRRTRDHERLARERIERLFTLAEESSKNGNLAESKRLVELARLIGKRYNQRLSKSQRIRICRKCNSFLNSGNSKNRMSPKGWKTVTCLDCGSVVRHRTQNREE
jgi:ribonuclease P protein subunit RPR2